MKNMLRVSANATLSISILLALASPARAQVDYQPTSNIEPIYERYDPAVIDHILLLLSDYHGTPDRADLERVSPDVEDLLLQIATDPEGFALYRDRALGALAQWPTHQLFDLYTDLLDSPDTPSITRHRVMSFLAVAFGEESIDIVSAYLDEDDLQMRLTAIATLGEMASQEAFDCLQRALLLEEHPLAIERIETSLTTVR